MNYCYRSLWQQLPDRYAKDMLSPFFRFLSAFGVQPEDVRDHSCRGIYRLSPGEEFLDGEPLIPQSLGQTLERRMATIPDWPKVKLTEPLYMKRSTGPALEDFPQGLWDDINAYCERIGKRHKTTSGKVYRPCRKSTIDTRRRELIAAVRDRRRRRNSARGARVPPRPSAR